MPRYLIEVAYNGKNYSGFQIQKNAVTIQSEVEKAMKIYFRQSFTLTGSSRTDAGVHALQNFFHTDSDKELIGFENSIYAINSLLPPDITVNNIRNVNENFHCRFDAIARYYVYKIYFKKNPFMRDWAYYYPYHLDLPKLFEAAKLISSTENFKSFAKRKTQVQTFKCIIKQSNWILNNEVLEYHISSNRFLRGMVRGLVGTMLHIGRNKITCDEFFSIIQSEDCTKANFSVPGHGLYLSSVTFKEEKFR